MLAHDTITAPLELKFTDSAVGEFGGMASVFGVVDSHGDRVVPGAFAASLAQHKTLGSMPAMYAQHGPALGGDPLPVGVWTEMEEDDAGLRVKGRISALDTDHGRRIRSLVVDGALRGLSIGYRVQPGGSVRGDPAKGGPARTLKAVDLVEVSLVTTGSNPYARVESIKSRLAAGEMPTEREMGRLLREACGLTRAQAEVVVNLGYKALLARRDGAEQEEETTSPEVKAALAEARNALRFSLPSFR